MFDFLFVFFKFIVNVIVENSNEGDLKLVSNWILHFIFVLSHIFEVVDSESEFLRPAILLVVLVEPSTYTV